MNFETDLVETPQYKVGRLVYMFWRREPPSFAMLWSFSNDDGDGNDNVKKVIGLITKTTTLHVHYTFGYISLPSLHDQDVKFPNGTCALWRTSTHNDEFFILFLNLGAVSKNSTPGNFTYV